MVTRTVNVKPFGPCEPESPTSRRLNLPFDVVALALQGGGALGSYQAGVVEGLAEAGIEPDWVAGISIGAINSAIIAGNPAETRVERLREFWETICRPAYFVPPADAIQAMLEKSPPTIRRAFASFEAWRAILEGQKDFFTPRGMAPWLAMRQSPTEASFYDTTKLRSTLETFADFDRINAGEMRVSVGAVNVRTGNFEFFDNQHGRTRQQMRPEHFMASGALPPGFPAIEIDGEFYWDGGLVSNTPLGHIVGSTPRRDTLAFQVDLWSAVGVVPENVYDVQERLKDIQFSSRTRAITDLMARTQEHRRMLHQLLDQIPAEVRKNDPWCKRAAESACDKSFSVVHLIYQDKEWEGLSKDYEFSLLTMRDHWAAGLNDIRQSLKHPSWRTLPKDGQGFATYDHHRHA
ncbi:MAG: patatin-like phospholipase family protein [Burkholderiales bacterium]|nr:patatin-like phospholipase family protein [Burkholderiales bacterium]